MDLNVKKLTPNERSMLDSILIVTPVRLRATSRALMNIPAIPALYPRIKHLAVTQNYQEAFVALARYKKTDDIPCILANSNSISGHGYTYEAIAEFPHPDFFSFLESRLPESVINEKNGYRLRSLYIAIATYRNEKAAQLLMRPFQETTDKKLRRENLLPLLESLQHFKIPLYENHLWELWSAAHLLSPDVYTYLAAKDPEKAYILARRDLSDLTTLQVIEPLNFQYESNFEKDLFRTLLDTVQQRDPDFAKSLILKSFSFADYIYRYPAFIELAGKIRDASFVAPLFELLEKEDNFHIFLPVAEVLLAYGDKNISHQVAAARKKNPALGKEYGAKDFSLLLRKHGLH